MAQGAVSAARRKLAIQQRLSEETDPVMASHLMTERQSLIDQYPEIDDLNSEQAINEESAGLTAGRSRNPRQVAVPQGRSRRPAGNSGGPRTAPTRRGGRSARPPARRARRRGGYRSSRYIRQTGIPAATDSITRFIMSTAGALIGAAVLYLLLTDAQTKGSSSAINRIVSGFANGLKLFIGQVDPLHGNRPPSGASATSPSSGASAPSASPSASPSPSGGLLGDTARAAQAPANVHQLGQSLGIGGGHAPTNAHQLGQALGI